LEPLLVEARPDVHVSSTLYGTVAVDVKEARAGVQGSLTLVDDDLSLWGKAALLFNAQPPYFDIHCSAYDTLSMLGGELDLVAQIWVPNFPDFWNWHWQDLGRVKLIAWDGLNVQGYLFDDDFPVPLK
jgi:hypothetical protein